MGPTLVNIPSKMARPRRECLSFSRGEKVDLAADVDAETKIAATFDYDSPFSFSVTINNTVSRSATCAHVGIARKRNRGLDDFATLETIKEKREKYYRGKKNAVELLDSNDDEEEEMKVSHLVGPKLNMLSKIGNSEISRKLRSSDIERESSHGNIVVDLLESSDEEESRSRPATAGGRIARKSIDNEDEEVKTLSKIERECSHGNIVIDLLESSDEETEAKLLSKLQTAELSKMRNSDSSPSTHKLKSIKKLISDNSSVLNDSSDDEDILEVKTTPKRVIRFTVEQFEHILWKDAEENLGNTECIEQGALGRSANVKGKLGKNSQQDKALYGRILFPAMQKIIDTTGLKETEIFADIGHGIGNASLHAAYTVGCESRGVEINEQRYWISTLFQKNLKHQVKVISERDGSHHRVGDVTLKRANLLDNDMRAFLSEADVTLFNNAQDIMGARSGSSIDLNRYVGGLFASMKYGSRLVTFDPLLCLGRDRLEMDRIRNKQGMASSRESSFFIRNVIKLGKDSVTWSPTKEVNVFIYTRVEQSVQCSVFLCHDKQCIGSTKPSKALGSDGELRGCVYCKRNRLHSSRVLNGQDSSSIEPPTVHNETSETTKKIPKTVSTTQGIDKVIVQDYCETDQNHTSRGVNGKDNSSIRSPASRNKTSKTIKKIPKDVIDEVSLENESDVSSLSYTYTLI